MTINPIDFPTIDSPITKRSMSDFSISDLPIPARIRLVEDIWDSIATDIAADPASLQMTEAQRTELDRRLETYASDGVKGRPADEAIEDIRSRLHR
uniref:Putative addiction module component, TIGR02574 family n=1 Tax=Candidatus Kentrum sp. SD TaxID=2126332 RepID=A0A450YZN0_9GAMM|nr:MAG: putative addiction module component, TIGR02574 family [Candidatus Kentron sp. SD]VFK50075.1 MAG: putative addiction module component, TIGR02574 family [Candidatus Kentron sp. SD]VFK81351.1 MAG: putative addiction module component, TIGR02574 family [Candidatus Kentron sp. SD]